MGLGSLQFLRWALTSWCFKVGLLHVLRWAHYTLVRATRVEEVCGLYACSSYRVQVPIPHVAPPLCVSLLDPGKFPISQLAPRGWPHLSLPTRAVLHAQRRTRKRGAQTRLTSCRHDCTARKVLRRCSDYGAPDDPCGFNSEALPLTNSR